MSSVAKRKTLSQELVHELFTYDDGKLFWRKSGHGITVGENAGYKFYKKKDNKFRWVIKYKGKRYLRSNLKASRLLRSIKVFPGTKRLKNGKHK